jgi:ABC-type sugar transport system permease subunit
MHKIIQNMVLVLTFIFLGLAISMGIASQKLKNENFGIAFAIFTVLFILSFFLTLLICCFKNRNEN